MVARAQLSIGYWLAILFAAAFFFTSQSVANDFLKPWKSKDQALIIDAYEKNPINWQQLKDNKNLRAFIGKASDGLPPPYNCRYRKEGSVKLCKKTFQNYWLKRELYQTRKMVTKSLGLKWGAYHLGRPGNPIDQANHFVDFADPQPDELIALDIEHDDPRKWISLKDAEAFARHVHFRLGRYPVLYTNHDTAKRIALQREKYPLLSRLPLWYARYRNDIRGVFPLGNWENYALWQFSSRSNCNKRRCPYRIKGTETNIDVNASGMNFDEFEKAWPFDDLVPVRPLEKKEQQLLVFLKPTTEPKRKPSVRYKVDLTFETEKGEKVDLATIAIPTPRKREAKTELVQLASLETEQTFLTQSIAPVEEADTHNITVIFVKSSTVDEPVTETFLPVIDTETPKESAKAKPKKINNFGYVIAGARGTARDHVSERYQN